MKNFIVKQQERFEAAWRIWQPYIVLGTTLITAISMVVLAFDIPLDIWVLLAFYGVVVFILWLFGFIGDRSGYLQEKESRKSKMNQAKILYHQYRLAAAIDTEVKGEMWSEKFPEINVDAAKKAVKEELEWFGINDMKDLE